MRLSLSLLLMVAAACCAPNSPMGPQAEECPLLGDILQDKFDKAWPEYVIVLSAPNVTADGNVICNSNTPHLGYTINDGPIAVAESMRCYRGMWLVSGTNGEEVLETAKARCYRRGWKTNQPENPKECALLGDILQDKFYKVYRDHFVLLSPPTVSDDGHVICNSSTPHIGYISNEEITYAESMVCYRGMWHVSGTNGEEVLKTAKARCFRAVYTRNQPQNPKECNRLSEIPKSQLDTLYPKADFPNYVIEGSLPTLTADGHLICNSSTRNVLYVDKNQKMQSPHKMMCLEGKWYVQGGLRTEVLENVKVSCFIVHVQ